MFPFIFLSLAITPGDRGSLSLLQKRRRQLQAIADVANGTPGQVYNLIFRQWQPGVVKDYSSLEGFWGCAVEGGGFYMFSGEYVAVESWDRGKL
ncbi:hypothetical protein H6G97_50260 [Nostoc flagelliforme FACHB-838]|uniref:Uncharacterized protein n=1 Tax=Nostoc flagelliforme FACHB-838 TaxID=2692904 RepID=A0ABR8E666_9NOSO|nr:hypothetical protein [Nostoc flagelliforme]MBD2536963.1 hypothetical protein [Nostoc flagelliforme FACHB-838]